METICNRAGMRGQHAGSLSLILDPEEPVVEVEYAAANFALDNSVPEDEETRLRVEDAKARADEMLVEAAKARRVKENGYRSTPTFSPSAGS